MPVNPEDMFSSDRSDPEKENGGDRSKKTKQERRGPTKRFLSIMFRCCNTYGRLYPNKEGTRYEGKCPRCGARTQATIGRGGTDRRLFETS